MLRVRALGRWTVERGALTSLDTEQTQPCNVLPLAVDLCKLPTTAGTNYMIRKGSQTCSPLQENRGATIFNPEKKSLDNDGTALAHVRPFR